jgi:hypothetical protein
MTTRGGGNSKGGRRYASVMFGTMRRNSTLGRSDRAPSNFQLSRRRSQVAGTPGGNFHFSSLHLLRKRVTEVGGAHRDTVAVASGTVFVRQTAGISN